MSILVVFDYDWSLLIDRNSDVYIFDELAPDMSKSIGELRKQMQWTNLMDHLVGQLFERGITRADIERIFKQVKLDENIVAIIKTLAHQSHPIEFSILSDANTEYIQLINSANEISSCFTETVTNHAHWDEQGRLHIKPYQDSNEPHHCKHCPVNLCKGKELKKMLAKKKYDHVIYIGDGHGDYCPCLHLQSSDAILARKDWALHKTLNNSKEPVNAPIFTWENGADMAQHIERLVVSFKQAKITS